MFDPKIHHRRTIRKQGYDYSNPGHYFVTICVRGAGCVLGKIQDSEIHLGVTGEVVRDCLLSIPSAFPFAHVDTFVIMPNHLHSIIVMNHENYAPRPTLGQIVRYFKGKSSRLVHKRGSRVFMESMEQKIRRLSGITNEDYDLIRDYVEYRKKEGRDESRPYPCVRQDALTSS